MRLVRNLSFVFLVIAAVASHTSQVHANAGSRAHMGAEYDDYYNACTQEEGGWVSPAGPCAGFTSYCPGESNFFDACESYCCNGMDGEMSDAGSQTCVCYACQIDEC